MTKEMKEKLLSIAWKLRDISSNLASIRKDVADVIKELQASKEIKTDGDVAELG